MQSLYELLKASKGLPSDSYAALWGKSAAESGIKTLTGRLPLFFKTSERSESKLRDWVIYGNDNVGENLVENIEQGTWRIPGFVKSNATTRCRIGNIIDVVGSQQYTMHLECPSHIGRLNIQFKNDTGESKGETGWQSVGESGSYTATIPSSATKATIILSIDTGAEKCTPANFTNVMLVKGSTAPDHYIPYQVGVGEKTENGYVLNIGVGGSPISSADPVARLFTRKTINLGESPLTEGQTLLMSEFGDIGTVPDTDLFIAAFEEFRYDSQLSYNQPTMMIKFKESEYE